jgi:hypothetical protein
MADKSHINSEVTILSRLFLGNTVNTPSCKTYFDPAQNGAEHRHGEEQFQVAGWQGPPPENKNLLCACFGASLEQVNEAHMESLGVPSGA